jgi:hypothetical protein
VPDFNETLTKIDLSLVDYKEGSFNSKKGYLR